VAEGFDENKIGGSVIIISSPTTTGYDPMAGGIQGGIRQERATLAELASMYQRMAPEFRKATAQKLKNAGYNVPVTGKYSARVREAFIQATQDLSDEITYLQQNDPARLSSVQYDLDTFLGDLASEAQGGGTSVTRYTTDYRPETINKLINDVTKSLVGRGATDAELKRYTRKIRNQMSKTENMGQSITSRSGDVTTVRQVEGLDPQQFLIEQIAGTDEAKAQKAYGFYEAFNKFIGRG
jgi:hypothetical protein